MLTEITLAILTGISAGIFTGLIPGIHINLVSVLLISISPLFLKYTSPIHLALFIIAMAITHSFLDVIPSTYLGAPDPNNALGALPAHKMLLQGRAYESIRLTVIGSYASLIIGILIAPLMYFFLITSYETISNYIFYILLVAIAIVMINKKILNNITFFILSGSLGLIALNFPKISDPLLPMLSGLFGTSILISSYWDKVNIPKQNTDYEILPLKEKITALIGATLAGTLTSFLPGLGASQGAAVAQSALKGISEKGFLILIGGINTINFTVSIVTYYAIQKARNGGIIAVANFIEIFSKEQTMLFIIAALITGSIAITLTLSIAKLFNKVMQKVNYQITIISVISIVTTMVIALGNVYSLLLYIASTSLGLIAIKTDTPKNMLMGCLLLPIALYFLPL